MSALVGTAVGALATLALAASAEAAVERHEPRVVVADGKSARLHVFTLDGERRGSRIALPSKAPASLTRLEDGRHVAAVQHDGDAVSIVDGGSWAETHGDHLHSYVTRPRLTPFRLTASSPSHVVSHGGAVSVFADGTGMAHLFDLGDMVRRGRPGRQVPSGAPHHGVAVPLGAGLLITAAAPGAEDGALPADVSVRDAAGAETGRLGACPELHGESAGTDWAAFACADGVLDVSLVDGRPVAVKLQYPSSDDPEARAWGLQSDASGRYLVGDFGARALLRIDRVAGTATTTPLPARLGGFAVEGGRVTALTADGRVHAIDIRTGRRRAAGRAVRSFDPESTRPRPGIAAGAGRVLVSDPARHRVRVLRAASLRRVHSFRTGGAPQRLAIVGVAPH